MCLSRLILEASRGSILNCVLSALWICIIYIAGRDAESIIALHSEDHVAQYALTQLMATTTTIAREWNKATRCKLKRSLVVHTVMDEDFYSTTKTMGIHCLSDCNHSSMVATLIKWFLHSASDAETRCEETLGCATRLFRPARLNPPSSQLKL